MQHIRNMASRHNGSEYVVQLLDHFECTGPNGTHTCLVLELMAQDVASFIEGYRSDEILLVALAKRMTWQLLQGLDFLQECGVMHNGKLFANH